jgi:hypothetical protein
MIIVTILFYLDEIAINRDDFLYPTIIDLNLKIAKHPYCTPDTVGIVWVYSGRPTGPTRKLFKIIYWCNQGESLPSTHSQIQTVTRRLLVRLFGQIQSILYYMIWSGYDYNI